MYNQENIVGVFLIQLGNLSDPVILDHTREPKTINLLTNGLLPVKDLYRVDFIDLCGNLYFK